VKFKTCAVRHETRFDPLFRQFELEDIEKRAPALLFPDGVRGFSLVPKLFRPDHLAGQRRVAAANPIKLLEKRLRSPNFSPYRRF
jgi:hypothetical protein